MIDAATTLLHRCLLMTLYSTGMRRAEVTRLTVNDIDSERMIIHIRQGKGSKDRDVPLSPNLRETFVNMALEEAPWISLSRRSQAGIQWQPHYLQSGLLRL